MSEAKRGALQSPADTARTTSTVVRHVQPIGANGSPMPSGATAADPIHVSTGGVVASIVGDGRAFVTTAGTRVALAASTAVKEVTISAELDNTGVLVVGGATVVAALATRRGVPLYPGDSVTIATDNLNEVYIDAMVSTDGCSYVYLA